MVRQGFKGTQGPLFCVPKCIRTLQSGWNLRILGLGKITQNRKHWLDFPTSSMNPCSSRNPHLIRNPSSSGNPHVSRNPSSIRNPMMIRNPFWSRKPTFFKTSLRPFFLLQKAPFCFFLHTLALEPENTQK